MICLTGLFCRVQCLAAVARYELHEFITWEEENGMENRPRPASPSLSPTPKWALYLTIFHSYTRGSSIRLLVFRVARLKEEGGGGELLLLKLSGLEVAGPPEWLGANIEILS